METDTLIYVYFHRSFFYCCWPSVYEAKIPFGFSRVQNNKLLKFCKTVKICENMLMFFSSWYPVEEILCLSFSPASFLLSFGNKISHSLSKANPHLLLIYVILLKLTIPHFISTYSWGSRLGQIELHNTRIYNSNWVSSNWIRGSYVI